MMRRYLFIWLSVIAVAAIYIVGVDRREKPPSYPVVSTSVDPAPKELAASTTSCPEELETEAEPLNSGPARLASVICVRIPGFGHYEGPPVISPDARGVVFWDQFQEGLLDVVDLNTGSGSRLFNRVAVRHPGPTYREDGLAWRSDGLAVWSIEQQLALPAGWAVSGLTPIQIDAAGEIQRFVPPRHEAGPLDALAWVGGDGFAIAEFGTRGDFYRPQREDVSPTLAMIDVRAGTVLDAITGEDAEALRLRAASGHRLRYAKSSAVQLPDGRLHAMVHLGRVVDRRRDQTMPDWSKNPRFLPATWLMWTQGEQPVEIPMSFGFDPAQSELAPDGRRVLAWRPLQPEGVIHLECFHDCPALPPVTPVRDTVAALVDTETGRTLWQIKATAGEAWNSFGGAVISPKGEYALIAIPAANRRQRIALLSMDDGRILQRFSLGCNGCFSQSFGFVRGGQQMWIGIQGQLAFYDLR